MVPKPPEWRDDGGARWVETGMAVTALDTSDVVTWMLLPGAEQAPGDQGGRDAHPHQESR